MHIALGALLRALGGGRGGSVGPPDRAAAEAGSRPAEAVAALLGAPDQKLMPPCRLVPQTSAPPA